MKASLPLSRVKCIHRAFGNLSHDLFLLLCSTVVPNLLPRLEGGARGSRGEAPGRKSLG